ncbi:MAG: phage tail protein [Christensenellales bacterium]|jgi:phage tail P2-like protein
MRLKEADIIRLLPQFMRDDDAIKGFASSTNPLTRILAAKAELLKTWNRIDHMPESELDELAWELNIEWYYLAKDISTKRALIKTSDLVHSRLGTKWAVETVLKIYFGAGSIEEWFEYGGEHHRFRIISDNYELERSDIEEFLEILEIIKRKSAWLDAIIINFAPMSGNLQMVGVAYPAISSTTLPQIVWEYASRKAIRAVPKLWSVTRSKLPQAQE